MARPRPPFGPTVALTLGALALAGAIRTVSARDYRGFQEVTVDGDHYAYAPARIEVQKDSLVKVTFRAHDIPHSFTIDGYRISKRAAAGQSVTFEFRADQTGTFPFYCNLTQDERCREMRGELIVR
jgi:heme/copper-type cytochrome/quinol oxidase subunit 2